jgi:uncharacterized protein YndB with AHSA1/START domain
MATNPITIETTVQAPLQKVWECWTHPEHITQWAFASNDWEAPAASNDVTVGGRFSTTMAAKDGSASFDFGGMYTEIEEQALLEYDIDDGRHVQVTFEETPEGTLVSQSFDPEQENSEDFQRAGWLAILENFKKHTEQCA